MSWLVFLGALLFIAGTKTAGSFFLGLHRASTWFGLPGSALDVRALVASVVLFTTSAIAFIGAVTYCAVHGERTFLAGFLGLAFYNLFEFLTSRYSLRKRAGKHASTDPA